MRRAWLQSAVAVAVIAGVVALAPGSNATTRNTPVAHASGFPSSINVTVPAGGEAQVTSPTLPASAQQATITVEPEAGTTADALAGLTEVLAPLGSLKARVLGCVYLYASIPISEAALDFVEYSPTLALLFLNACVQIAVQLSVPPGAQKAAAATGAACKQAGRGVAVKVSRVGGRYRIQVKGMTAKPKSRSPLLVTCRRIGAGFQLAVRPRARGRTLSQVVGPTLTIGYASPPGSGSPVGVHTAFAIP
jgi:hypothetical protein